MAKIIIEFDSYEHAYEVRLALNAGLLSAGLDEFKNFIRSLDRVGFEDQKEEKLFQKIQDKFFLCFEEAIKKIE